MISGSSSFQSPPAAQNHQQLFSLDVGIYGLRSSSNQAASVGFAKAKTHTDAAIKGLTTDWLAQIQFGQFVSAQSRRNYQHPY